ncbi:hypothetical protein B484DRAFT_462125 [Ochromonadaceae sp. CCMP2298]|nr:hypothetical protein B484DRAFT_462125 [Ochromonadaceae sp. CCMP2298]
MRTESVTEDVLMSNGDIVSETRPWAAARDQATLNTREGTYVKRQELLKSNRGKVWTTLIKHCTPIILSAVEQEATYLQVQTECDSLELFLLMEKVCMKRAMNNAEAHRTRWYELKYLLGGDIFGFFNEFEEMKDNILQATGEEESIKDPDMVYRLREAMPESISKVVLLDTHTLTKEDPDYPKYTPCKNKVVNYVYIPGNYISRSGTALGANRSRNTDESVEEEEMEDDELEEEMGEIEDEEPEEGEIMETDTTETPLQIHVTINGIVYEASDMQSLDALLRPHVTRPQIPEATISINAPDCQLSVRTAQTAPAATPYIPSYIQPRTKAQHDAARLLQEAYDSKLDAPTDADRTLAAQKDMYKAASRTSCIPVEEEWKEVKRYRKAKPTYKEDIFASSSNSEGEYITTKMPPNTQHSLYEKGEEGVKYGVDAGSMDAGTSIFNDDSMDRRKHTYTPAPKAPTPEPQSPAELQQQEEDDHAYAQALQLQEDGEEEVAEEEEIEEEAVIEAQTQADSPEEEEIRLQDNKGPFLKDPKNYKKLINLVRPPIHNKFSRAGGDGIGTPGKDPDHDVRRPFDNSDIKRYRRKLIKSGNKQKLRELNQLVGWRCVPGEPVIYKGPTPPPSKWIPQRSDIKNAYLHAPVSQEPSYLSLTPDQREQHCSGQTAPPVTALKQRTGADTQEPLEHRLIPRAKAKEAPPPDPSDSDSDSSSTSDTSTIEPAAPTISQRIVHANLLRLERAKADDFRQHPDRKYRVEMKNLGLKQKMKKNPGAL